MLKRNLFFLLCFIAGCSNFTSSQPPAEQYLDLIDRGLANSRSQMPAIVASAQEVATRLVAGGNLYAAKGQAGFRVEAINRAGGMMCLKWLSEDTPAQGDIVLIGIQDKLSDNTCKKILDWKSKGAYVVAFGSKSLPSEQKDLPNVLIDNCQLPGLAVRPNGGEKLLCPTDTVMNVVNLWVWTGELVSACTRLGKMPILYQSYGLPGGKERAEKYKGKTFHDDMVIEPVLSGQIGNAYLDAIRKSLNSFRRTNMGTLAAVSDWWQSTKATENAKLLTIGHLFPGHFQDSRAPQLITIQGNWDNKPLPNSPANLNFVLVCGYQDAPEKLVAQAKKKGFKLAYISVKSTKPAEPADNIIYLNPFWPLADGCVIVKGYDIPILPASGVVNASIYWALLSQVNIRVK